MIASNDVSSLVVLVRFGFMTLIMNGISYYIPYSDQLRLLDLKIRWLRDRKSFCAIP